MPFVGNYNSLRLDQGHCPHCHHRLTGTSALVSEDGEPITPEPGDVSICSGCASLLVFDESLRLRPATEAEWREARSNLEILEALQAAKRVVRGRVLS